MTFPGEAVIKDLPANAGDMGQSLGGGDSLEKEMATHSGALIWEILWKEDPGGLQSMGSQRVGHDGVQAQYNYNLKASLFLTI